MVQPSGDDGVARDDAACLAVDLGRAADARPADRNASPERGAP